MLYYILVFKMEKNNEYILEMILAFNNDRERDNYFQRFSRYKFNEILTEQIISFIYNEKDEIIANKYLLNEIRIQNGYNNNEIIKNYLKIILEYYKNNENIYNTMNSVITITPTIKNEEFYIMNKKWFDEFKYIFSYDEILNTLNENKRLLLNANAVDLIFNNLSSKLKTDLKNLDENIISSKFNNLNLYKLFEKNNNYFLYFDKCVIIKKQILDLLKINNNQIEIEKANCILGDGKIFLMMKSMVIIGNLSNNLFMTEYVINLNNNNENFSLIENIIKIKGFDFIYQFERQNKTLKIKDNDIKFIIKVVNLNNMKYDDSNIKNFDDKIKFLLIVCIYQLKIKSKINDSFLKNSFLLSSEFLSQLNYDSLFNTINNIIEIDKELKTNIESYIIKEKEILFKFNKYLNNEIILDIEKNLKQINIQNLENYSKQNKVVISNKKMINVCKSFIIVDKDIISLLISLFNINAIKYNDINLSFLALNKKSSILINERNNDNILLAYIMNNENFFQLEYIFNYSDRIYLNSGLMKLNYDYYDYFYNN